VTGAKLALLGCTVVALGLPHHVAWASEHVVRLVTEGEQGRFSFEPPLLFAEVGDTVRFVPEDAMHAVKSVPGMLPDGVAPWRGRMGEEVVVRLDRPGVYGVKCRSGYEVGMVGLLVVGDDPPNWDRARAVRHPPMASHAFAAMFADAGCRLHLEECPD
jgi:pseudoazurin